MSLRSLTGNQRCFAKPRASSMNLEATIP